VVITRQEEQRAELEVLQVERTRAMRGRISDLEAELASAEGKAVDLAGRNAALTSEMRTLRGAADDLLRLLAAPASDAPSVRRELQAKYRVFIGQTGQQEPADGAVAAASSLTQLAGALDGMVKRAERGRGSITALRAAVSDVRAPYCVCVCVCVCVCLCLCLCVCVCTRARIECDMLALEPQHLTPTPPVHDDDGARFLQPFHLHRSLSTVQTSKVQQDHHTERASRK
jgi:hypothetical protein